MIGSLTNVRHLYQKFPTCLSS
uniref:Uncharacterized protein n=1 Tax=Rhizophora mucronata TaxID=61149 RepID=A0A2P2QXL0_RHIMU